MPDDMVLQTVGPKKTLADLSEQDFDDFRDIFSKYTIKVYVLDNNPELSFPKLTTLAPIVCWFQS